MAGPEPAARRPNLRERPRDVLHARQRQAHGRAALARNLAADEIGGLNAGSSLVDYLCSTGLSVADIGSLVASSKPAPFGVRSSRGAASSRAAHPLSGSAFECFGRYTGQRLLCSATRFYDRYWPISAQGRLA